MMSMKMMVTVMMMVMILNEKSGPDAIRAKSALIVKILFEAQL